MESHTDTAVAVDPVAAIPDSNEPTDFASAIDAAMSSLENAPEIAPEPAQPPEPTPEPAQEAEPVEPAQEPVAEETEALQEDNAADPDLLESLTDNADAWTPKAANRFKQLKSELKVNRSEMDQLRQTLTEQESQLQEMSGLVENRDIDQLQERVDSFEHEQTFSNLENTTAYQTAVTEPLQSLLNKASSIAEKYDIDSDNLVDALSLEDPAQQDDALEGLLSGASERDRASIYRVIEDLNPILQRRETLIENAGDALKEALLLEEQRRNSDAADQAHLRTNITRNVVQRIGEKLPFLSGVENLDMNAIGEKAASLDPAVVHPVDFAYNAVAAQLVPTLVREYLNSNKEVEALMNKLAEYEDAEPTMSGTPNADGTRAPAETSFADAVEAAFGG